MRKPQVKPIQQIFKKLASSRGESLVETLTALVVAVVVLLFLTTAVVVAARVNNKIGDTDTSFHYATIDQGTDLTVSVKDGITPVGTAKVKTYTDDYGCYRYYEKAGN